jgi:chemotaxis protein CheD
MKEKILGINELHASLGSIKYTCYGLGSCIGLFITDRRKGLSGGAHIALPNEAFESKFSGASKMINDLLAQFSNYGSDLLSLRAKVTGGGQVVETMFDIGKQNIDAVLKQLTDKRIFIASIDVGGKISRTARFNSISGEVKISTSEQKTYII